MIRVVIVLFWLSLLIGTLFAHNLVANRVVSIAGLYFPRHRWTRGSRKRCGENAAVQSALPGSD
jgi:hypothetical protein